MTQITSIIELCYIQVVQLVWTTSLGWMAIEDIIRAGGKPDFPDLAGLNKGLDRPEQLFLLPDGQAGKTATIKCDLDHGLRITPGT